MVERSFRGEKRMKLRLRQIAGVAGDLSTVEQQICRVLGVEVCYRDKGVAYFGLENALFPIGNQLLEVVAPIQEGTAGGRYLERRKGDGGYMVITQCDDHPPRRARAEALGVRIVHDNAGESFINMQLHPRDTGGTFFEIDQQLGEGADDEDGPWHPAGPNWQRAKRTERVIGIRAAEVQCDDPEAVARKWAAIAERVPNEIEGGWSMLLDDAEVRFVACQDGRPEGLGAIDLAVVDRAAIVDAASAEGCLVNEWQVMLCGMRMNLVEV